MSTTREDKDKIIERLSKFGSFSTRPMMGEYLLYLDRKHIGGIYDGLVLLKLTENNAKFLSTPELIIPYPSAKPMLNLPYDIDEDIIAQIFDTTFSEIQNKRK